MPRQASHVRTHPTSDIVQYPIERRPDSIIQAALQLAIDRSEPGSLARCLRELLFAPTPDQSAIPEPRVIRILVEALVADADDGAAARQRLEYGAAAFPDHHGAALPVQLAELGMR